MPRYSYLCGYCGSQQDAVRSMERRNDPLCCEECGEDVTRLFVANFNLNTSPEHLRDENKFALGHSATDRLATMKADDVEYDRNWEGAATGVTRVTPEEAFKKMPLNSIFPHS